MDQEEQDKALPIANVGRIMKQNLPPSAKISKEGKQLMQECVTEFISFVTAEASDKCHKENRKTVNGDDICWALSSLGFDNYAEAIAMYLHKYRQAEREKIIHNNKKYEGSAAKSLNQTQLILAPPPPPPPSLSRVTHHKVQNPPTTDQS
ncbi:nuclear transcription factor Y subunit B-4-like [Vigna unguiculata]|uniref:Nuclear transcription factor Y n=1 Tax=Vigna unguiculata TaxID=3917 RepID=A0A4D6N5T5_VIGUN|nr:nuclear transcription factor Y subunit B-4-like [Vigna unguiculata]QCE07337.1 nuclear transcription factor Y [Vigna unguiculata]QCE07338.1 nuclear transcription factor Y [Vigna unguiculata]